ncbi:MAG: PAS domain S-box protein [bacterium]|nr:PAS domain S-box protein [bacterium]
MDQSPDMISDSFESFFRKHDAVFLLMNGETGQLIDANDAALRFYGYSLQQIKSMKIGDINKLPPEELDAERQRAVKEERKYFIVPHLLANGEFRTVEVHTTPIVVRNKTYLFSVIHDITGRKFAEETLMESGRLLNEAQQIAHIGSWSWIVATDEVRWSKELYEIVGRDTQLPPPTYAGGLASCYTKKSWRLLSQAVQVAVTNGTSYELELDVVRPDGKIITTNAKGRALKDKSGRIVRLYGTVQDITERKLAEKVLFESEEKYRRLFDNAILGIFQSTPEGKALSVNYAFARMFGYDSPEDVIKNIRNVAADLFVDPNRRTEILQLMEENPDLRTFENVYRRKDGSSFIGNLNVIPVRDFDGSLIRVEGIIEDITERKKAEKDLRQIEIKLQAVLESTADGILAVDNKGKVINANQRFINLWRIPKSIMKSKDDNVLLGFVLKQLIDPDAFLKKVKFLYGTDKEDMDTLYFKDGRIFERFSSPLMMEKNIPGRVWSFRDITERKKNEERLKASEKKYSNLVEKGNDGIIIMQDNILKYLNSIVCRMTGFKREELIGKPFINYVSPEYKKIVIERYGKRLKGYDIPNIYEIAILAKGGRKTLVEINANQIEYEGKPASMAIIRDITERKRMEKILVESEERYRTLIENINLGITLIDKNYKIVMVNSEFCRRTGIPKEKAEGMLCYKICANGDSVCPDCPGTKTMASKKVVKAESEYLSYDGSRVPVIIHTFPVLDPNNEAKAFIEISEDISEYKKVEKAKKNLIRDLSHGLKTPVSMIEMSLGIIQNSMESGDKESLIKAKRIAEDNIKKVRRDINGILNEFSMEMKKEALIKSKRVIKKASLKTTMKDAVKNIKSCLKSKDLKLSILIPPNADKIKINNNDLRILLNNLLDNAIKFTYKGKISVISILRGKMIDIKVKDTGCGISARDINRVFDKFYKHHAATDGTGLGLSICKELVEMYHGKISIYSEGLRKGATVVVSLPKA